MKRVAAAVVLALVCATGCAQLKTGGARGPQATKTVDVSAPDTVEVNTLDNRADLGQR